MTDDDDGRKTFPNAVIPGPHFACDGRMRPPIGTLGEQLRRATEPALPPLTIHHRERLLRTIHDYPCWGRALVHALQDAEGAR